MAREGSVIDLAVSGSVAEIRLTNGHEFNLIDGGFIAEFRRLLSDVSMLPDVRCVVLTAEGTLFCAGGRIQWLQAAAGEEAHKNLEETEALVSLFTELNELPLPVIAAVQGGAFGGAVGLLCACDIVIAERNASFSLSEARLGLVPACAAPFVIAKIGQSWARRLFITGERITAERALAIGLIHELVPQPNDLTAAIGACASAVLSCSPQSSRRAKDLVLKLSSPERRTLLGDVRSYVANELAFLRTSGEAQEGMQAFVEKRMPRWMQPRSPSKNDPS